MKITAPDKQPKKVSGTLVLNVSGKRIVKTITVPEGRTDLGTMIPEFQELTNLVVDATCKSLEEKGVFISCKKGCAACCRQLIPITHIETKGIIDVISRMPEQRRKTIIEKFEACSEKLSQAGLYEKVKNIGNLSKDALTTLGIEYFNLQIPCPFLEDESCSIYKNRPLACREYLVTSPAINCTKPTRDSVQCVSIPIKLSVALAEIEASVLNREVRWTILTSIHKIALEEQNNTTKTGVEYVNLLLGYIRSHSKQADNH